MDISLLDLVLKDPEYLIYYGNSPLLTKGGRVVSHPEQRLLKHIITEFQLFGSSGGENLKAFHLLEFQIDHISKGIDFISDGFDALCENDEFIRLKTGKKSHTTEPLILSGSDLHVNNHLLMTSLFWGISSMVMNLNKFIAENIQKIETDPDSEHPFILLIRHVYTQLPGEQKSAINLLSHMHHSGIVLPLLFVLKRITASEYATGVLSVISRNRALFEQERLKIRLFPYPTSIKADSTPSGLYLACLRDGYTVMDYLSYFNIFSENRPAVSDLIKRGESGDLEFKSTFRWDLKAAKTNNAVERASLKTISAFLNTSGGILLIGVRDDGSAEGIESDRFANEDKFLLHLWTLIRTSLGRDVSPYIQTLLEKMDDKTICIVICLKSPKPVFLRQPGFNEEFFIRVGPSSNALDISEALRYVSVHFKAGSSDERVVM